MSIICPKFYICGVSCQNPQFSALINFEWRMLTDRAACQDLQNDLKSVHSFIRKHSRGDWENGLNVNITIKNTMRFVSSFSLLLSVLSLTQQ